MPAPGFERVGSGGARERTATRSDRDEGEWGCHPEKYKTQLCLYFMEQVRLANYIHTFLVFAGVLGKWQQ